MPKKGPSLTLILVCRNQTKLKNLRSKWMFYTRCSHSLPRTLWTSTQPHFNYVTYINCVFESIQPVQYGTQKCQVACSSLSVCTYTWHIRYLIFPSDIHTKSATFDQYRRSSVTQSVHLADNPNSVSTRCHLTTYHDKPTYPILLVIYLNHSVCWNVNISNLTISLSRLTEQGPWVLKTAISLGPVNNVEHNVTYS